MANDWSSDQDELGQFPSAASPLSGMGLDPDLVRANPSILENLRRGMGGSSNGSAPKPTQAPPLAAQEPEQNATPASSPATTATETEPTDLEGYGKAGLSGLYRNTGKASQAAQDVPTQTPTEIDNLSSRQEALEHKTPLRDASGKMLDQYKPSIGSRIWRGVRGGALGFLTGGIPGGLVGALEPEDIKGGTAYGAPNKQYERAEDTRQQELGATTNSLENARKNWEDSVKARKAQAEEFRATAGLDKDLTTGATGLINAENKPETEERKADTKLQLNQKEFTQRAQQLQTDPNLAKLSPLNKAYYMAEGKVYQPRESTEADLRAAQIARGITILGHPPQTLEELNQVVGAAEGNLGRSRGAAGQPTPQQLRSISDKKAAGIEKAMAEYAKDPGQPESIAELQGQLTEIQNAYEEALGDFGMAGTHQLVTVGKDGQVKWTPVAAPAPAGPATGPSAQAAPQGQPPPGATHIVPGKDGKKHYTNAKGTIDYGIAP